MNISIRFHKDRSFCWGDICKTILTFRNYQFSMYFAYFHSFAPPKSSKMFNYWIIIKIFRNKISKCTFLMNKKTPVPAHRLLCSPTNKQIVFDSFQRWPCILARTVGVEVGHRTACKIWNGHLGFQNGFWTWSLERGLTLYGENSKK